VLQFQNALTFLILTLLHYNIYHCSNGSYRYYRGEEYMHTNVLLWIHLTHGQSVYISDINVLHMGYNYYADRLYTVIDQTGESF